MLTNLRGQGDSPAARGLYKKLDILIEGTWLLTIFLLPVYFNHSFYNPFYFIKALVLVSLVSLMLGLVLAQWFLLPHTFKVSDLSAEMRKSPLQLAALVLGLMWAVSTVFSIMPGRSLWGNLSESAGFLPNFAWIIFFLVIVGKVKDRVQVLRALYVLLISSGIVSLLGVLQIFSPNILPGHEVNGRVFSTDGNPLSLSGFLAMTMPIILALVILNWYGWESQPRSRLRFAVLLALFVLQLCCLAFAQYSITLLLYVIGIFVFFALIGIFLQRMSALAPSVLSMLLVVVIAAVLLGQLLLPGRPGLPPERQVAAQPVTGQRLTDTLTTRMQIWKCAVDVVIDSPRIPFSNDYLHFSRRFIGYGPETFIATSQLIFPDNLKSSYTSGLLLISQPENHYLYLAVTLGILGLMAFLALLAVFYFLGFRLLSRSNDKTAIVLGAAFIAAVAQYCAHVFFNPSFIMPELVFWLVLGLTVVLDKIDSDGDSICGGSALITGCLAGQAFVAGNTRKTLSILVIIIFLTIGAGLTLPLLPANMKVRSGFNLWDKDQGMALASFTEATQTGPRQSYYYDILGNIAFVMANQHEIGTGVKNMLLDISESAGSAAMELEPQLAAWRFRLADREMYWVKDGGDSKKATILYLYNGADQLFPRNAVILNKWALALMLMGDYEEAGQRLDESRKADPLWTQNSYYDGLLKSLEGHREEAGDMYVLPEKGHARLTRTAAIGLNDIDYFISFCGQAASYGVIGRVSDDLRYYVNDKGDWIAWSFLGIADVYAERQGEALAVLSKAAELIPDGDIAELKGVIIGIPWNSRVLQSAADEIIASLSERQVK